jgi:hypothetical protein
LSRRITVNIAIQLQSDPLALRRSRHVLTPEDFEAWVQNYCEVFKADADTIRALGTPTDDAPTHTYEAPEGNRCVAPLIAIRKAKGE